MPHPHRTLSSLLTAFAAFALLAPGVALADDEPSCGDGKRAAAARVCGQFEAAAKLGADDPNAKKVLAVWRRVAPPVEALSGRHTALSVLAPDAMMDNGKPFPPAGFICPGAPPTVYVPHTLVDRVYGPGAEYDEHFLAFVLAHELGHRINDFTPDGCQLGAFERPGKGVNEEQLADFRGAFFAAVGGYSTRTLATDKTVGHFLKAEFRLRDQSIDARQKALVEALGHFDAYEGIYEASLGLLMTGDHQAAQRLLAWADELVSGHGVPLPELKVVRALALLMDAGENAPWLEYVESLPLPLSHLRCNPIFPSHTALWEEPKTGQLRGPGAEREQARKKILEAKRLIEKARELGANALVADTVTMCADLYLGDVGGARRWQQRASGRLGKNAPQAVKQALAANEALLEFMAFVRDAPAPSRDDAAAAKAWGGKLAKQAKAFQPHAELADAVAKLEQYPEVPRARRGRGAPMLACEREGTAAVQLASVTPITGAIGQCPTGWDLTATVPPPKTVEASGTTTGVTMCEDKAGRPVYRVKLAEALDPPLAEVDQTLLVIDDVPEAARSIDVWACHCDALQSQGASDLGEHAYMGACPAMNVPLGVIIVGPDGRVARVISVAGG